MTAPIPVGAVAPDFRLPTADGREVALADYRGRSVIVWFTKGMACPFCRQQMSQLARGAPRLRELGAEILQVTPSTPSRAALYAKRFPLPFPYLCDPDFAAARAFGLDHRSHGLGWYAKRLVQSASLPQPEPNEFGPPKPDLVALPTLMADQDAGFFVVDRGGVVRVSRAGSYMMESAVRPLPTNDEIAADLERLGASGA